MPTAVPVPPSPLATLCGTAARALRCAVHLRAPDGTSWGDAPGAGADVLRLPFADDAGLLTCARGPGAAPWTDDDRALAADFARLAGETTARLDPELHGRLAELERHVQEMQAITSLGSFEWHVAEDRVTWSPEQLRIHGLDAASHPRSFADVLACVHPEDRAAVRALTERMLREGRMEGSYRIVRPDGERVVHSRGRASYDADGRVTHVIGTSMDVTTIRGIEQELRASNERLEQRVAERTAALQRSEEHFRRLIEHAHDLIVIVDNVDGSAHARYGSPSVRHVLGYDPETLRGTPLEPLIHEGDRARAQAWLAGLATPGTHRLEYRFRHADGRWLYLEAVSATAPGAPVDAGHVINIRDVTERREAEERLRRSEEHFRTLIENAQDMVVIVDPEDARHRYQSPSVARVLGYEPAELAELDAFALVHPEDLPHAMAEMSAALAHPGTTRHAEYRYRHKDGSWRHLESFGRTLSATSAAHGLVFNTRDVTDRVRAAEALRESEARYRSLIEQLPAIIYTAAIAEGYPTLFVSPQAERLLGFAEAEWLSSRLWLDAIHPADQARVESSWEAAHREGRRFAEEYRIVTRDGRVRWFRDEAMVLRDADGQPLYIQGIMLDITDRREAERALEEREQYYRALIENSHDIVTILDPEGRMGYQSPSLLRVLGYTVEELEGHSAFAYMHPDDAPKVVEQLGLVVAEPGSVGNAGYRFRHKDGTWRYLEAFGRTLSPTSAAQGVVANVRDVTERREAELALQRSEEHFRALIERSYDLVQVLDAEGRIVYTGPSVQRLLGYSAEEISGMAIPDFMHPDDLPAAAMLVARLLAHPGTSESLEYRVRHRDGTWRWFEAWARTLSPTSAAEGLVANARDVTSRREALEALRQAKADAEQARVEAERANRAKSEFLSRMSHELRTPLNSILGFAQVLEDVEMPPAYRGGVRHILNAGRHLLQLIDEVLDIARIEADAQPLSIEPVPIELAVRQAIDMVSPLAAKRGIRVAERPPRCVVLHVRADRQRLVQVLLNLLSNAVKYNREHGTVHIGCETVTAADGTERLRVRVEDEGRGIAPDQREQLFVPFARLGAEHSGIEGTGLGLALSQRLAQAMGATLALERTGEEGSAFVVDLVPVAGPLAGLPAMAERGSPGREVAGGTATLLYVEDNLANLSLVETILGSRRPGWRVVPALQGRLGLDLAAEHAPDVVLLDLHLPDMHGREVLRHLRADARTAATPVVVISADATPSTVDTLTAQGADAFLTKPLDVRAFLHTVDRLLARVRPGR